MKRFMIDGILILLLVAIGSNLMDKEEMNLDDKLEEFEGQINNKIPYDPYDYDPVNEHRQSKAVGLAVKSGEVIEGIVGTGVEVIASIFNAFVE